MILFEGDAPPPASPNCPLETGLRPCLCKGLPRCPICNYTAHDAAFEMDHARCPGRIPPGNDLPPYGEES